MNYSTSECIAELKFEIGRRKSVYPKQVMYSQMTQVQSDKQIGIMEQILRDYEQKLNPDDISERQMEMF